MRATTSIAWLGLVLAAACAASPPRLARPGTLTGRVRAEAPLGGLTCEALQPTGARLCAMAEVDVARGMVQVTLRVDPAALPSPRTAVALAFREAYVGPNYARDFVRLESGEAFPSSIGAVETPYEIRYEVSLDLIERGDPPHALAGVAWRRPGGFRLTGKSFLPDVYVDGEPVEVPAILLIDPGDAPLFSAAGTDQRIFEAPSLIRLADESYEVGPLTMTRRQVGGTTLWLGASGDLAEGRVERLADVLADAMRVIEARLGPPPTDSVLFTFHRVHGGDPEWGERLGSSLVQVYEGALVSDVHHGDVHRAIHELVHLWNPGTHVVREDWIEEGFTDYLTVDVVAALIDAPPDARAYTWFRAYERYAGRVGDGSLRDEYADAPRFSYDAGMVTGFCLDSQLRRYDSSLSVVLQRTLDREESGLGPEAFMEDLAQVSPESASYLEALAMTRGPFAIDDCMERAGFRVEEVTFRGHDERTVAIDILRAPSSRTPTKSQALELVSVDADTALSTGDLLLRVAGHPVATLTDVSYAVRDVAAGTVFEVQLHRNGEARTVELTMPALEGIEPTEQTYVLLSLSEREPP